MKTCPACKKELKPWHIKAECPYCGANIPNHNWEQNLETDALAREAAFYKMHVRLNMLKYSVVGSKLRLARLIMSFLPIIGYIVPLAALNIEGNDGTKVGASAVSALAFFMTDSFKFADVFSLLTDSVNADVDKFALIALILLAASLLFGVIAFFLVPLTHKKPNSPVIAVFHLLSLALYCSAPAVFLKFVSEYRAAALGECTGSVSFGVFIGAVLFAAVLAADIILAVKKVNALEYKYVPTDDTLQREYALSIGAITEDEMPFKAKKEKKAKKKK